MTLNFKYKRVKRPNGIEIKSPMVPITLSGKGAKYEFIALLDSGADISVIPLDVAELLNADLSGKKEEVTGIGGFAEAIQTTLNLEISRPHEPYSFTIPVKVLLTKTNTEDVPILLGRAGFFDKFEITFDQKNERIHLKKNQ
ncbi:MAG: hypothetical protein WCK90_01200 [archaeon]